MQVSKDIGHELIAKVLCSDLNKITHTEANRFRHMFLQLSMGVQVNPYDYKLSCQNATPSRLANNNTICLGCKKVFRHDYLSYRQYEPFCYYCPDEAIAVVNSRNKEVLIHGLKQLPIHSQQIIFEKVLDIISKFSYTMSSNNETLMRSSEGI